MRGAEHSIEVSDLVKTFHARAGWRRPFARGLPKRALDSVSLYIPPGEVFGLLGPNGAGKTTLIKILSTLILPTSGTAFVAGHDVVRDSDAVRRRVGVVYGDERTFYWRISVRENLRFYAALYHIDRTTADARIRRLLEQVGLERDADVPMHHFSTGMKQRAAIARGLLSNPEILVLDEPTRGLDPLAARDFRTIVRATVADGTRTVLVATHVMDEAAELCNRVAIIHRGQIQLEGSIQDLRAALQVDESHHIVVSQLAQHTLEALTRLPGLVGAAVEPMPDGRLQVQVDVRRGSEAVPHLVRRIVDEGGAIWSVVPRELSLEEMFALSVGGPALKPATSEAA